MQTEDKENSCGQCGYSTISTTDLKKHMLIHSGEKPFNCTQCNFSCTQAGSLKTHMLTHSGEKPFTCTQCDFSCRSTDNLRRHLLVHSGKKRPAVHSVAIPAQELIPSRHTCEFIPEKNPLVVSSANIHAQQLIV